MEEETQETITITVKKAPGPDDIPVEVLQVLLLNVLGKVQKKLLWKTPAGPIAGGFQTKRILINTVLEPKYRWRTSKQTPNPYQCTGVKYKATQFVNFTETNYGGQLLFKKLRSLQ